MEPARPTWRPDAFVALLLAAVLGAAWTWRDWANLSALHLPDTDDVVRLQQIRDWLAGQGWADLTQHRLGMAGVPMHWSRLADLGPGAAIAALTPLVGRHQAEVAAVVVWPLLLFAAAFFLVARIARRLDAELAGTAAVIAAIAYPATTVFLPGRIDHHGLQMVLLLAASLATLRPASASAGFAAGLLAAASLVVGLETAPLIGMLGAAMLARWAFGVDARGEGLCGLGIGALAGLAIGRGLFATSAWDYPACDGFDGQAWRAEMLLSLVPLGLFGASVWLAGGKERFIAAFASCVCGIAAALLVSPDCLTPYGRLAPELAATWLAQVGEAQPLVAAPPATGAGYVGLMLAGIAAAAWRWLRTRSGDWAVLLALQCTALAVTVVQLRGAYAGALLAAPALAAVVRAARTRGALPLAGAWAASAGMLYPLAADALTRSASSASDAASDAGCDVDALLKPLSALPPGTVVAPVDLGAWGLAATPHRFLAAPYHRDGAGMLATARFYAAPLGRANAIAARWRVRYAVGCPGGVSNSMAAHLAAEHAPGWRRVAVAGTASIWARDRQAAP